MNRFSLYLLISSFFGLQLLAQDELLELLDDAGEQEVTATFKSTRLINGHTVEVRTPKVLEFLISHRFGAISLGSEEAFGLDQANIRLGLEYGLVKNLNVGIGRSSFDKVWDTFVKYRAIRQTDRVPVTVTGFASVTYASDRNLRDMFGNTIAEENRYDYTGQLLIARKMNSNLSLQFMPTVIYRPLVPLEVDDNTLVALGMGGRYKVTSRVTINAEYFPQVTDFNKSRYNAFSMGVDIETGGHVFQLHLTNAQQMNEPGFIGETNGDYFSGDIHFGFNISRVFQLGSHTSSWD